MVTTSLTAPSGADVAQMIQRRISLRTWGNVRELRVETGEDRMLVYGQASSYYIKQLAIRAILEVLDSRPDSAVNVNIQVGASNRLMDAGPEGREGEVRGQAQSKEFDFTDSR